MCVCVPLPCTGLHDQLPVCDARQYVCLCVCLCVCVCVCLTQDFKISYPCVMLNVMVAETNTNPQYLTLTDPHTKEYKVTSEMSIEFEVDGPYKVRVCLCVCVCGLVSMCANVRVRYYCAGVCERSYVHRVCAFNNAPVCVHLYLYLCVCVCVCTGHGPPSQ